MNNKKFWMREMKSQLTVEEFRELNVRMRRLLSLDIDLVALSDYDELLAEYGLEPDYLMAWIG